MLVNILSSAGRGRKSFWKMAGGGGGDHFQAVALLVRRFHRGSKGARATVLEREERNWRGGSSQGAFSEGFLLWSRGVGIRGLRRPAAAVQAQEDGSPGGPIGRALLEGGLRQQPLPTWRVLCPQQRTLGTGSASAAAESFGRGVRELKARSRAKQNKNKIKARPR